MKSCDFCREFGSYEAVIPKDSLFSDKFGYRDRVILSDGFWYFIPTAGAFTKGYTLLVSKAHRPSLYHCSEGEISDAEKFTDCIGSLFSSAYSCRSFMFEHGIVDQSRAAPTSVNHAHLHFLPLKSDYLKLPSILKEQYGLVSVRLDGLGGLQQMIRQKGIMTYLLYGYDKDYYLVDISSITLPSQFLRKIIYEMEYPQRDDGGWNWKTHPYTSLMVETYDTLCSHVDKLTGKSFSRRAESYESESEWIKNEDFTSPLIPEPFGSRALLDVACGTGILSEKALEKGWRVTSLDNCKDMLDGVSPSAKRVLAKCEDMPFEDSSFDAVICRQGLQYMNIPVALGEMIRVCRGRILLLHATVDQRDVALWQKIFTDLGYLGKSIIHSNEISNILTTLYAHTALLTSDGVSYTDERLSIPDHYLPVIEDLMEKESEFVSRNLCRLEDRRLYYRLEWHLICIERI